MVAALEGVCGLFYPAVVVARLVAAGTPPPADPRLDPASRESTRNRRLNSNSAVERREKVIVGGSDEAPTLHFEVE